MEAVICTARKLLIPRPLTIAFSVPVGKLRSSPYGLDYSYAAPNSNLLQTPAASHPETKLLFDRLEDGSKQNVFSIPNLNLDKCMHARHL